jgi:NADP-dependent aldehyde dehydrogenase
VERKTLPVRAQGILNAQGGLKVPAPILIAGQWRAACSAGSFRAENPATAKPLAEEYPISTWDDCEAALEAATAAFQALRALPADRIVRFLETYAVAIEARADELAAIAHAETALPILPRLKDIELARTTDQLRQAATAAREGSWALPTIDTKHNLRSCYAAIGPVCVFGPNNFPFAYESIAGGDFAAAIAVGNSVIAKGHPSHPGTSRMLAELAQQAADQTGLPPGTVQLIYQISSEDGLRLVADRRMAAIGYTGSRSAGLALKAAADAAGKPIYLELSSINPVVILPGALRERGEEIAEQFTASCLSAVGQFCTNPGLVLFLTGPETEKFIDSVAARFKSAPVGTLLSGRVAKSLDESVTALREAGAQVVAGATAGGGQGHSYANTLLRVSAAQFIQHARALQAEAFGNESLFVIADDADQLTAAVELVEGNLTGSIYSSTSGEEEPLYNRLAPLLRQKVGRMLNDKMPTGVVVSPAMNHGGPYPATGHPGFTAVGFPAALRRFAVLQCYDHVRPNRLPPLLRDKNPTGHTWRLIDGAWTTDDVRSSR